MGEDKITELVLSGPPYADGSGYEFTVSFKKNVDSLLHLTITDACDNVQIEMRYVPELVEAIHTAYKLANPEAPKSSPHDPDML